MIENIEHLAFLGRLQRILHSLTGLPLDLLQPDAIHSSIIRGCNVYSKFCDLVRSAPEGNAKCEACTAEAIRECMDKLKMTQRTCHMGLTEIYVPIVVRGKVIGILSTGQLLSRPLGKRDIAGLREKASFLKIRPDHLIAFALILPLLPINKVNALAELIEIFTQFVTMSVSHLHSFGNIRADALQLAINHMEQSYNRPLTIDEVAKSAKISPSRLCHIFKEKLNTSFVSYLNNIRMDKASSMLIYTSLSISEIADQLGIQSLSHFNHLFKRRHGISPSKYRLEAKGVSSPCGGA